MARLLTLLYHAVSSSWRTGLAISERTLEHQLSMLHRRGYVGFTFAELERLRMASALPPRSLAITFDDGFASVLRAKPILDRFGFPATVFIVKTFMETGEPPRGGADEWLRSPADPEQAPELLPLDWRSAETLVEGGWEIGSHTLTHPLLPNLADDEVARELELSRAWIIDRLGRCDTLAYPYGRADARVAAAAAAAGYLAACTATRAQLVDEPQRRPRVELVERDVALRLRVKLSPLSLASRRSSLGRAAHHLRRRRDWLPQ